MIKEAAITAALLVGVTMLGVAQDLPPQPCGVPEFEEGATNPIVSIQTEFGCIYGEIFVDELPLTGGNFLALVEDGLYDGSPFHRVIPDFMMQGGDYTMGNGRGGAAHPDFDEDGDGNIPDEFRQDLRHDKKGIFSMANAGPNTGGSQFFITFAPTSWLDDRHAVFGEVVAGMDAVDQINEETGNPADNGVPPLKPVTFIEGLVHWPGDAMDAMDDDSGHA